MAEQPVMQKQNDRILLGMDILIYLFINQPWIEIFLPFVGEWVGQINQIGIFSLPEV